MSKTRGRALQREEGKNSLLRHVRIDESLKKKEVKCLQEMETFVSLRLLLLA